MDSTPVLTPLAEREVARVLAAILAARYPGTRWTTAWEETPRADPVPK